MMKKMKQMTRQMPTYKGLGVKKQPIWQPTNRLNESLSSSIFDSPSPRPPRPPFFFVCSNDLVGFVFPIFFVSFLLSFLTKALRTSSYTWSFFFLFFFLLLYAHACSLLTPPLFALFCWFEVFLLFFFSSLVAA